MLLTKENYFDLEVEREFMSRSQYLGFMACEAKEMAKLSGAWVEEKSEALLVGSYLHSWNEGTRSEFVADHPGMFTRSGGLRAEYKQADVMISTLEADPLAMYMLQGDKELVFTAEFAGAKWKVMADIHNAERKRMVDLKSTRSIRGTEWNTELGYKANFIENYHYILQAALYCEIERLASGRPERDWLDFFLVAVSKEKVPDKEVIDLRDPERYLYELEMVQQNMPRVLAVKAGEVEPVRCERCDYCRATKHLTKAVHYTEIGA